MTPKDHKRVATGSPASILHMVRICILDCKRPRGQAATTYHQHEDNTDKLLCNLTQHDSRFIGDPILRVLYQPMMPALAFMAAARSPTFTAPWLRSGAAAADACSRSPRDGLGWGKGAVRRLPDCLHAARVWEACRLLEFRGSLAAPGPSVEGTSFRHDWWNTVATCLCVDMWHEQGV